MMPAMRGGGGGGGAGATRSEVRKAVRYSKREPTLGEWWEKTEKHIFKKNVPRRCIYIPTFSTFVRECSYTKATAGEHIF